MFHGVSEDSRLVLNLTRYGATSGCWLDNCAETDVFTSETLERCSVACFEEPSCHWWTWGTEDGVRKCWLREKRNGREKRFGFASGHRHCADTELLRNESDLESGRGGDERHNTETEHVLHDNVTLDADSDYYEEYESGGQAHGSHRAVGLPKLESRKLYSYEDDDFFYPGPSSLHMPIFGYERSGRERRKEQEGESCRIHGYFDMNKVPGNFHIGSHGNTAPSFLSSYSSYGSNDKVKNMEHVINRLAFVDALHNDTLNRTQILDGFESPKAFTFQYYLTVTPATVLGRKESRADGYQFRAGSFVTNELLGPAVFFRLDIDPIRVTYYMDEICWSKFLVNLCAVVGGCIALCKMLEECLEAFLAVGADKE